MKEEKVISKFVFSITYFENEEGIQRERIELKRISVKDEIVIMKMKAHINLLEKNYFDKYGNNMKSFHVSE